MECSYIGSNCAVELDFNGAGNILAQAMESLEHFMGLGITSRAVKQIKEKRKLRFLTFKISHSQLGSFVLQSGGPQ
jgi:hypothetical protein